jgi:hypothetical protein
MTRRAALAAAWLLLLTPGIGTASSARCPQLTDPTGDQVPVTDPAADLVSLALGSDRSTLTLVLRYAGEQPSETPVSGHDYLIDLNTGEGGLTAQALVGAGEASFALYRHAVSEGDSNASASGGTGIGRLQGRVDARLHAITMTIPFAMASDLLRPRQLLSVSASAATSSTTPEIAGAGRPFVSRGSDQSDTPVDYRIGVGSCAVQRV